MTVCSEISMISFQYRKKMYSLDLDQAKSFFQGIVATCEKTSLIFERVVIARTIMIEIQSRVTGQELSMYAFEGSLTAVQFEKLLNYPVGIRNQDWVQYLTTI